MYLRHAWRSFRRSPAVSLVLVFMMALGVAGAMLTFALVDAALFRPPPFDNADKLVLIHSTHRAPRSPERLERWSHPRIAQLRLGSTSWESLSSITVASVTLSSRDGVEQLHGEYVSQNYFSTMGVRRALLGRLFADAPDNGATIDPVVVLSHELWRSRFAGDSTIIGRHLTLSGHVHTVVGIAPARFRGLSDRAQLWIPETMAPLLSYPGHLTTDQNFISVVARLKPGVTLTSANEELPLVARRVFEVHPMAESDSGLVSSAVARTLNDARVAPATRRALVILSVAVAMLYLLAVTNVVNLLLGRAGVRMHELAVRAALGARQRRLITMLTVDNMLPLLLGAAVGIMVTIMVLKVVPFPATLWNVSTWYGTLGSFAEPSWSTRILAFGVALTVTTALVVAIVPATLLVKGDLIRGLQSGGRAVTRKSGSLRSPNAQGAIVAAEAALSMMLLVIGGLMIASFSRMRQTDLGIDARNVLLFDMRVSDSRVSTADAPQFIRRILAAIEQVPTVVSASVDGEPPVTGSARSLLYVAGRPVPSDEDAPRVRRHYVAPAHFRTLGIPVVRGRGFTDDDREGRPRVAVISANAAAQFWPNEDPIGQRIWFSSGGSTGPETSAEIVGIVGDVAYNPLHNEPFQPDFYTPYAQFTYPSRTFVVKTNVAPAVALRDIQDAMRLVEPSLPLLNAQSMTERIGDSWARQRLDAVIFGAFASVALLLAITGIYAVVAHAVAQRTREMGIRIALGATPVRVVSLVVREGLVFPLVGLLIGIGAALGGGRLVAASLYEVSPAEPTVMFATAVLLLTVSVVACLGPAVRAARVNPLVTMTEG